MSEESEAGREKGYPLANEAADWFAKLRGPDAEDHRPGFERWLARGALHRAAYNRVSDIFAMGKCLAEEDEENEVGQPSAAGHRLGSPTHWFALVATALFAMALGAWLTRGYRPSPSQAGKVARIVTGIEASGPVQLASRLGEIRSVTLDDGSRVTLDSDTLVSVAFDGRQRRLRLERGRARFNVAHEGRPFVVAAGPGRVTARGTIFDVAMMTPQRVSVKLLRGRVDVDMPVSNSPAAVPGRRIVSLTPGQQVAYAEPAKMTLPAGNRWTDAVAEFDAAPLREVIEAADATSPVRIRIDDPQIKELKVSGSFRINDGRALGRRLAALFHLRADESDPMETVLRQP